MCPSSEKEQLIKNISAHLAVKQLWMCSWLDCFIRSCTSLKAPNHCPDDESRANGLFAWAVQVVWGLLTILICLLWEKDTVKVSVGWGNLEQMLYQGDIEILLFYQKQQKMRKAITHFLETGSVTVLRYQSKLQVNANRSEGLSCDFKTILLTR